MSDKLKVGDVFTLKGTETNVKLLTALHGKRRGQWYAQRWNQVTWSFGKTITVKIVDGEAVRVEN